MTRSNYLPKAICHEVELYDLFFGKFTINISRIVKMFTHTKGLIFLAMGVGLLFATDANGMRGTIGNAATLLIWTGAVLLYLVGIVCAVGLFSYTQNRFGPYIIYTPITSAITLFFVFTIAQEAITFLTKIPKDPFFPLFFNIAGASLAIETLFIRFVLPDFSAKPDQQGPAPTLLRIAERQLPLHRVAYMNAQEHYVHVTLGSETIMLRGRLGDAVAQTTPQQGFQPHRSWWISATAKPVMSDENGKPILKLFDGTTVPIAKARKTDVQDWIDLHRDW